ncbi:MAG: GH3 auxin-responsive promoter family protein [Flavobacteriales bacterium]|nr:GH3 auxin-responsive promoter family protein [Flavobacteriales bacterium]
MFRIKSILSLLFARYVIHNNKKWKNNAIIYQEKIMRHLVNSAVNTKFGVDHSFKEIQSYGDFKESIPVRDYEGFKDYIDCVKSGEENVLWPGKPIYLCKTSGTTSGTKYIPITKESISCHLKPARDAILNYIQETKNTSLVNGKMIFLQGSPELSKTSGVLTGRLSGIVAHHIPFYLKTNRLPSYNTNCIEDWEKKVDAIVDETISENMTLISGIPPWVQMYFEKLIKKSNKKIKDLFPNFQLFIYGGVNYRPYAKTFSRLIGEDIDEIEVYPASEGFIAYQDSQKEDGMLLCVNNGIFFEFIKTADFSSPNPTRISLSDVKLGVDYVILLSTNAGLWGYNIGDTIRFTSINPYRVIVSGRMTHFTSAFGEHVIAQEVDESMNRAILKHSAEVKEFHVAPQINPQKGLPYHQWFIEFVTEPKDSNLFTKDLDGYLQNKNSYYKDLIVGNVLKQLEITKIKKNGFNQYMQSIGKLGGQNKVPRLSNDREIAEKLILLQYKS